VERASERERESECEGTVSIQVEMENTRERERESILVQKREKCERGSGRITTSPRRR
jgi:hypothetical protein